MRNGKRLVGALTVLGMLTFGGGVWGEQALHGIGILTAKDGVANTVTINAQVFRLSASTEMRDLEGGRLEFAALPVANSSQIDVMFEYEAVETARGATLTRLQMSRPPE